jgi:hypothetical protein
MHDEIKDLLAGYAINALTPDEARAVSEHLGSCAECTGELLSLAEAVDALAEAVPRLAAPEHLRARVLADAIPASNNIADLAIAPAPAASRRRTWLARLWRPESARPFRQMLSGAALLVLVALSATTLNVLNTSRQIHQELVQDRAALGLLTSTETINDLLTRESNGLPLDAHGHWFHRPGVMTQVVVGERLPPPPSGQRYVVWMEREHGWMAAGDLQLDDTGYGRVIIMGSDSAEFRGVEITMETEPTAKPGPAVMLRSRPPSD